MDKPDFDKLVQNLVNASHEEGRQEAVGTQPMQGYYDRTHAAVNALLDAIGKATHGVAPSQAPSLTDDQIEQLSNETGVGERTIRNILDRAAKLAPGGKAGAQPDLRAALQVALDALEFYAAAYGASKSDEEAIEKVRAALGVSVPDAEPIGAEHVDGRTEP